MPIPRNLTRDQIAINDAQASALGETLTSNPPVIKLVKPTIRDRFRNLSTYIGDRLRRSRPVLPEASQPMAERVPVAAPVSDKNVANSGGNNSSDFSI